jgi:ATP-binding cassette, subfamily G (WHITE), member 2, SNQ2
MADPTSLTDISEEDNTAAIPTLPGPTVATDSHVDPISSPPSQRQRARPGSSTVDIGHFDPQGVDELRRSLSRASNRQDDYTGKTTISRSDLTLAVEDEPFDFEKYLRDAVKKCAS